MGPIFIIAIVGSVVIFTFCLLLCCALCGKTSSNTNRKHNSRGIHGIGTIENYQINYDVVLNIITWKGGDAFGGNDSWGGGDNCIGGDSRGGGYACGRVDYCGGDSFGGLDSFGGCDYGGEDDVCCGGDSFGGCDYGGEGDVCCGVD